MTENGPISDRPLLEQIVGKLPFKPRRYTAACDPNVQLTTIFANRARGTLNIEQARKRLVRWDKSA
jgi:hypothetical protein